MRKKILAMLVITLIATAFCGIMVSGDEILEAPIVGATPTIPPVTDTSTLPTPTFTMTGDAGYRAESRTADPVSGDIVFDACFQQAMDYAGYAGFTQYGIFIYNTSEENPVKADIKSTDILTLYTYKGFYNATVTDIQPENFESVVVAVPYIIVDGEIITGTPFTYTVDEGGKWLGDK